MLGGISIWQLLIVFVIVILVFGTKKLRSLGGDLGGAVKGFKNAINEDQKKSNDDSDQQHSIANDEKDASFDNISKTQSTDSSKNQENK